MKWNGIFMKKIAIIPARLESMRFPEKLLKKIHDKTILQRTFENTKKCSDLDEVYIATDHEKIAEEAERFHAKVLMTKKCKNGTERIAQALENNVSLFKDVKYVINVQGDHPCIRPSTIQAVLKSMEDNSSVFMSTAAVAIPSKEYLSSPHIVKCILDQNNYALYFSRSPMGFSEKEKNLCYQHLGIYGFRKEFLMIYPSLSTTPLQLHEDLEQLKAIEHGYRIKVALVDDPNIAIDTLEDFELLQKVLANG